MTSFVRVRLHRQARPAARILLSLTFVSSAFAATARAQTTEIITAFDSSGRVRSVAPPLAARLGLQPPVWPVNGVYTEAKLYTVSTGGFVIVVDRGNGRLDRYLLTNDERELLRSAIAAGMLQAGRLVGEEGPTLISGPARSQFIRNQMLLSALLYGPAVSALTHDASAGAAAYLLTTGGSFFYLANLSTHVNVSRAQNHLATDGALRGTLLTFGTLNTLGIEPSSDGAAVSTLVGGIGGTLVGYEVGKRFTDSEAHSATTGSTWLAATTAGVAGTLGLFDNDTDGRAVSASLVTGAVLGYPLGLAYTRRASYTVTAGDVSLINLGGLLGAAAAGTTIASSADLDGHVVGGVLTAGWLTGSVIAERTLVRRVDHTESEGSLVWLGALAGGLIGGAIPVLAESDDAAFITGAVSIGGILGTIGAESLLAPARAGALRTSMTPRSRAPRLQLSPQNLVLAALGRSGRFVLGQVTF